jgi:DNA-directed RNA polymerase I and III subunit RPAC1
MTTHYKILKSSTNKLSIIINNIDLSIINAIRRIILSEIPNVAFYFDPYDINHQDIKIKKNTGCLHNEFIAQRISLLPIWLTENEITNFEPTNYKFILKIKNNSMNVLNVTTSDFDIFKNDKQIATDIIFPKNIITNNHILITKLKPNIYNQEMGDELDIECMPTINIAKTHSRWCPVSKCCYFNVIDEKKSNEFLTLKLKDSSIEERKAIEAKFNTLDKYRYYKTNKYDEACEFQFEIESECRLRPTYLIFKALLILINKVELLKKNIENATTKIVPSKTIPNFYELTIKDEDFTLLNVIQCLIYNNHFRSVSDNILEYIGYNQTHPLDNIMILKIKFTTYTNIQEFMISNLNTISEYLKSITKEWIDVSKLNNDNIIDVDKFI